MSVFLVQKPRTDRYLLEDTPPLTGSEERYFSTVERRLDRSRGLAQKRSDAQRTFLARVESIASRARKLDKSALRRHFGKVRAPGFPPQVEDLDVFDLVSLPEGPKPPTDGEASIEPLTLSAPEPFRPTWIDPREPWPPSRKFVVRPD